MEYIRNNENITLLCEGALTNANAGDIQQAIYSLIEDPEIKNVIFDFNKVSYISSSGLRIIMSVTKRGFTVQIINACSDVYEVLDITGFTSLLPVSRKMRALSIDDCKLIGTGFFSKVYRVDADSIVKVYIRNTQLDMINRERELARNAFLLGIPAAITFDIVDIDGKYGLLFESINGGTLTQKILSDIEHLDQYIIQYANLLKTINTTQSVSDNIPRVSNIINNKLEVIKPYLEDAEYQKLSSMLTSIEDTNTFVHADCHTGNIMLQNDELIIIDMDTLCTGNPIFELAALYVTYIIFEECSKGNNLAFLKLDVSITSKLFYDTLKHYFAGISEQSFYENVKKIQVCGYFNMLYWNRMNKPENQHMFDTCLRRLIECLSEVDDLNLEGV